MDPFGNSSDLKEEIISQRSKCNFSPKTKKNLLIATLIISLLIVIVILIIFLTKSSKDDDDDEEEEKKISEILCNFRVVDSTNEISLLSEAYENINQSIINIEINNTKIEFTKKYKFPENGVYPVKFLLNKTINMDYMFKDILSLVKVEMYSNVDTNILSMKGSFENCKNLQIVYIEGFNTEKINSTQKLFCNTSIYNLTLKNFSTYNVEDMSYMFSSTNIRNLSLDEFDTKKVKNMSNMFSESKSIMFLNLDSFNTSQVEDMSSMFKNCWSLEGLNINNFETSKVKNMSEMFYYCYDLVTLDVSLFDTREVTSMS